MHLGKPLEMGYTPEDIRHYLEGANAYPLTDFVPSQSRTGQVLRRDCVPSMRGYVRYAQEDDDLNYMCLAVKLLERGGPSFTTLDVGMNWLQSIPFLWTWGPSTWSTSTLRRRLASIIPKMWILRQSPRT
jgi:hypothetical protein